MEITNENMNQLQFAIDLCSSKDIRESDLDELVYDCVNDRRASYRNNSDVSESSLDRDADQIASSVNNEGITGQLSFLIEECGFETVEKKIRSL